MERKNAWAKYDEAGMEKIEAFAKNYCAFLDHGKTERARLRMRSPEAAKMSSS